MLEAPIFGFVISEEKRKMKNNSGKSFWQVVIKTKEQDIKCFMWQISENVERDPAFPHRGDIIQISDFEDRLAEHGNIVIHKFARIKKEEVPENIADVIFSLKTASAEDLKAAFEIICDSSFWSDENNHAFVMKCLAKVDRNKLLKSPAANTHHHNYAGGLLVHTAEVLELCRLNCEFLEDRYPFLNKDVVYVSAILHDIGKVDTYKVDDLGIINTDVTEYTIGHMFYGMNLVQNTAKELSFDQDFVNEVLHCIASHHDRLEWGSYKTIRSAEAVILSRADYISGKLGSLEVKLKEVGKEIPQEGIRVGSDIFATTIGLKKYAASK